MSDLLETVEEQEVRELQRVVIKEELLALTEKHFDAALLNNLIFWAGITKQMDNTLKEKIRYMEARKVKQDKIDKQKKKIRNGWFYKTGDDLMFELMNWGSASTISRTINNFVKKGWVEKGNNPDPSKKWDRTTWFKINLTKIASDLHTLGYALDGYTLMREPEKEEEKHDEPALQSILHGEKCILQNGKSILHSGRTIPEGILQKVTSKDLEEEEENNTVSISETTIIDLMNSKIKEREITNQKTIKAVHDVSSKCKAIGTTDLTAAENYVIKVVEEKMAKFGQKQKVRQGKAKVSGSKSIRSEMIPKWKKEMDKEDNASSTAEKDEHTLAEERKRLEEVLKKYKKDE